MNKIIKMCIIIIIFIGCDVFEESVEKQPGQENDERVRIDDDMGGTGRAGIGITGLGTFRIIDNANDYIIIVENQMLVVSNSTTRELFSGIQKSDHALGVFSARIESGHKGYLFSGNLAGVDKFLVDQNGVVDAKGGYKNNGLTGVDATWETHDGKTVICKGGIIVDVF